ncbi:hypothetical protein T03_296 [Trichinella britovi]|uniref:Uncharacterized protein n=1 Tax=Trichinella britovi TaxID=45882 RepID=A0A0V1CST3_TRIBR|nr:hypothetical protein T03_296 [Trichinella britovi]
MHETRKIESKHTFGLTSKNNCSLTFLRTADAFELRLVPNRCGGMSFVYEDRAYKLKYASPKRFVTAWDKQGCKGAVSTNLDVPTATLKKRTAEVTKSIPEIYDEEVAAASVEPSTAGQYPVFKQGMKSGLLATNVAWAQTVHSRFYQNGINNCSLAMPLQWGCYFHFCQAVHRKVGELGLETRYQTEEETKIKMHLATAFIPVPQVDMGVSQLELSLILVYFA